LSVGDDGLVVCNGSLSVHLWIDLRAGHLFCSLPELIRQPVNVEEDSFLRQLIGHFNRLLMKAHAVERPIQMAPSELTKHNLTDAAIDLLTEVVPDKDRVALAYRLDDRTQQPLRHLLLLQLDLLGIWRVHKAQSIAEPKSTIDMQSATNFWLTTKSNELGLCVDWTTGEVQNVSLAPDVAAIYIDWCRGCVRTEFADDRPASVVMFPCWSDIPSVLLLNSDS
jgi:hypothetical protein